MKKILFILVLCNYYLNAQNTLFIEQKDSNYLYSINAKLSKFEQTKDVKEIYDLHFMAGSFERVVNRNRNPILWEKQTNNNISQALQIWNRVANYPNFDFNFDYNRKYETLSYPNCYDEPKFVYYGNIRMRRTGKIDIENIRDEKCKNQYLAYYRNVEVVDREFQYQKVVKELHQRIIFEIINLFDRSEFTSVDEINTFVLPNVSKYIDSEKKQEIFKQELLTLINIIKQKPILKK